MKTELGRFITDNNYIASGVPCSILKDLFYDLEFDKHHYFPCYDEAVALGILNGYTVGGRQGVLITQNSAFGKVIDIVLSFNIPYNVPLIWIMSMRGDYPDTVVHQGSFVMVKSLNNPDYECTGNFFENECIEVYDGIDDCYDEPIGDIAQDINRYWKDFRNNGSLINIILIDKGGSL